MPKTINDMKSKSKSKRKPLRDVSNGVKASQASKKRASDSKDLSVADDALDRLLLVHSDLSALIRQIDELVVLALNLTTVNKTGMDEIESFAHILTEMQTSLKPWIPRFEKALCRPSMGSENKVGESLASKIVPSVYEGIKNVVHSSDHTKMDSLVSPSPLVTWRADCTTDGGRQLFLLTPLPQPKSFTSKLQGSSKSPFGKITSNTTVELPLPFAVCGGTNDDLFEGVAVKVTPGKISGSVTNEMENTLGSRLISPEKSAKRGCSMLVMTPCLKMSPPKSCVLLEPISEFSHKDIQRVEKSTPFPVGVQNFAESQNYESSNSKALENLFLKYPELFGIKPEDKLGKGRKLVDESPNWMMSPPKTCVLMEPADEKSLTCGTTTTMFQLPRTASSVDQQTSLPLMKENSIQKEHFLTGKCFNKELAGISTSIESTPLCKDPKSFIQLGRHPGENTLKRELWTKFDAASTHGIHFKISVLHDVAPKGFLDRLDEVSCDDTGTLS